MNKEMKKEEYVVVTCPACGAYVDDQKVNTKYGYTCPNCDDHFFYDTYEKGE